MTGKLARLTWNRDGSLNIELTVTDEDFSVKADQLKDKLLDIDIRQHREKRSKDANAFCWEICTTIGNAMHPPVPKEEVYRKAIREVGFFYQVLIREEEALEPFMKSWSEHGTGWFAELVDFGPEPGSFLVNAYCGSSTYDTERMSRLIEYLLDDARQSEVAIPLSAKQESEMLSKWAPR
jgi:hypothetical protein